MEPKLAVGSVGEGGLGPVGVGGVTRVVGASCKFGGVAGVVVMILSGVEVTRAGRALVPGVTCICGGSSKVLDPRREPNPDFFPTPPNRPPRPPPLVPDLTGSVSAVSFSDVDLLVGAKASLSLPTGDGLRFAVEVGSSVLACFGASMPSMSGVESARLVVDGLEPIVSEAIKREEVVRYPVCEW